ncbi:carcinoembryonic antigen-related cell adhesion molecule 6-like isoform X2 [Polyodon spathula]|uniref:carcinoembryonic antigen-related cell adhesion molecule 6-like isoform X2 n=1 Tax=Polyodon spathula TaxID=7913 RepID=UPI001B7EFC5A|nr:carcinoembryonic antigen-related cell adhesion molecule 6-like isoform X2 [Polyodon spathula]
MQNDVTGTEMTALLLLPAFALISAVSSQFAVDISVSSEVVQVRTGQVSLLAVKTLSLSEVLTVSWASPSGQTLGVWVGGQVGPVLNEIEQYHGRLNIAGDFSLRLKDSARADEGGYTITVDPKASTGVTKNSRVIRLEVFDPIQDVSISSPSPILQGDNVTLTCRWTQGTKPQVTWGLGGVGLTSDPHVAISGSVLRIARVGREDAGNYTCRVTNAVSAGAGWTTLDVSYGPDLPSVSRVLHSDCVSRDDVVEGRAVSLSCGSDSNPPARFSWALDGRPVSSGNATLFIAAVSREQGGRYTCTASNAVTGGSASASTAFNVVGHCLSGGAIAGIVIGSVAGLFLLLLLVLLLLRWRKGDHWLKEKLKRTKPNPPLTPLPRPQPHGSAITPPLPPPVLTSSEAPPVTGPPYRSPWSQHRRGVNDPPTPPPVHRTARSSAAPPTALPPSYRRPRSHRPLQEDLSRQFEPWSSIDTNDSYALF